MIIPLFFALTSCPDFKVVNKTSTWNDRDKQALIYAMENGCRANYPNSPCVKYFAKVEENTYNILCGAEKKK